MFIHFIALQNKYCLFRGTTLLLWALYRLDCPFWFSFPLVFRSSETVICCKRLLIGILVLVHEWPRCISLYVWSSVIRWQSSMFHYSRLPLSKFMEWKGIDGVVMVKCYTLLELRSRWPELSRGTLLLIVRSGASTGQIVAVVVAFSGLPNHVFVIASMCSPSLRTDEELRIWSIVTRYVQVSRISDNLQQINSVGKQHCTLMYVALNS
jgi:hypothetical protein